MQFSLEDQVPYVIQDQDLAILRQPTVFVLFMLKWTGKSGIKNIK